MCLRVRKPDLCSENYKEYWSTTDTLMRQSFIHIHARISIVTVHSYDWIKLSIPLTGIKAFY